MGNEGFKAVREAPGFTEFAVHAFAVALLLKEICSVRCAPEQKPSSSKIRLQVFRKPRPEGRSLRE
jgi:hypothetical protein